MNTKTTRNLNPTPEAIVATCLYCDEYVAQRGGTMDFWDKLDQRRKGRCKELADKVIKAARKHAR